MWARGTEGTKRPRSREATTARITTFRIARALIWCYPRTWRERYGGEVAALLDDTRIGARDVFDLARGCGAEWAGCSVVERLVRRAASVVAAGFLPAGAAVALGFALAGTAPSGFGVDEVITMAMLPGLMAVTQIFNERRRGEWDAQSRMLKPWLLTRRETIVWRVAIALGGATGIACGAGAGVLSTPALAALALGTIAIPSMIVVHHSTPFRFGQPQGTR